MELNGERRSGDCAALSDVGCDDLEKGENENDVQLYFKPELDSGRWLERTVVQSNVARPHLKRLATSDLGRP